MKRTTKTRLQKAQVVLKMVIRKILDINRMKKNLAHSKGKTSPEKKQAIREELKILNKLAQQQSKLVALYQSELSEKAS